MTPNTRTEAGILVLLDMVEYTPQVKALGDDKAAQLARYFKDEIVRRASPRGFEHFKALGDAALLFGKGDDAPRGLIELMLDLFTRDPIPPHLGFQIRLRMIAHHGWFKWEFDQAGRRVDVHGSEAIKEFRIEKLAETWRLLVTDGLFAGLQECLEPNRVEYRSLRLDEPLQGLEILGNSTLLHKLIPPEGTGTTGRRLHEAYRQQREKLREEVQTIPVFGGLFPAIPMGENFINLSLRSEDGWRSGLEGRLVPPTARENEDDRRLHAPFPYEFDRDRVERDFSAEELFARFCKGCILGMPGAGKTTILKHFVYRLLEDQPNAVVLFLNCRELRPGNLPGPTAPGGLDDTLRALTVAFLYPDVEPAQLSDRERKATEAAAEDVQAAWRRGQATVLIDALDETPGEELKNAVVRVARQLFDAIPGAFRDAEAGGNRFFLSARKVEQDRIDPAGERVFEVRDLTQDQMRLMAERFFGRDSATYRSFDQTIWQEPVVQKMGGTPLTALLLLFYFDVMKRFDVRYATYDLLLKFVLLEAWEKMKSRQFQQQYVRLNDFFEQVKRRDFLDSRPDIARQVTALAALCHACFFDIPSGESLRDVPEQEMLATFRRFLRTRAGGKLSESEAERQAKEWFDGFRREHLLIAAGHRTYRFVHSTVMEFLAAHHLLALKADAFRTTLAHVAEQSKNGTLETLPIACGESCDTGYRILKQLPHALDGSPTSTLLPFRCLAEVETAERERLHGLKTRSSIEEARAEIRRGDAAKRWVYAGLQQLVLDRGPAAIRETAKRFAGQVPLCQPSFQQDYLEGWNDGGSDLVAARTELLKNLLHRERFAELVSAAQPAGKSTEPGEDTLCLLTLDRPGDPHDKNFAYYRGLIGPALQGFFGSPNLRHSGPVRALAFSRDSRWVVSGSEDGALKLWEVSSGREVCAFAGHAAAVTACALSADGGTLVSGSDDKTLKLWEVSSGREVRAFAGHTAAVRACALSADGGTLVSGSDDKTLKLWEVSSGREVRAFAGHTAAVSTCALSSDGGTLVSGSSDKTLKLWEVSSGREVRAFAGHRDGVRACALSSDGGTLVSGSSDKRLKLWEVSSGREVRAFAGHRDGVWACALSADGGTLVSGSSDKRLKLWEVSSGREVRAFAGHRDGVWACALSADGGTLVSGSRDKTLKLWEVSSGREVRAFAGHTAAVWACALSSDGGTLVSGSADGTLKLWEVSSGREVRAFAGHVRSVRACALSADGGTLVSGSEDRTLKLWEVSSGREVRAFAGHTAAVVASALSADGGTLVSGSADRTLKLWEVSSGREVRAFAGHTAAVVACALSADGGTLVSGSADRTLKLWEVSSGREVRAFAGHTDAVWACALSADGGTLVSGSYDRTLKLWEVSSGREVRAFAGHTAAVWACALSADGGTLVSGSADGTLKLWDVASGKELASFAMPWTPYAITFSRAQPHLFFTANLNGTVTMFDFSTYLNRQQNR